MSKRQRRQTRPPAVHWYGEQLAAHSLSYVNRQWCRRLLDCDRFDLVPIDPATPDWSVARDNGLRALVEARRARPPGTPRVVVRHAWPPQLDPVLTRRLVLVQPWEFGGLPADWIEPIRRHTDEIWCYTPFVRNRYIESGIPEEKLVVTPLGVDGALFRPDGPTLELPTDRSFKFLFVGGAIGRKGIDVLLESYGRAFTSSDDVALVVKASLSATLYRKSPLAELVAELRRRRNAPEIVVIDDDLPHEDVAALYRSCDRLVHPYRGEGFGLPVAEAMATGLPVIVTAGGACDAFVDADRAVMVPARRTPIEHHELPPPSDAGYWLLEPDRDALVELLRAAPTDREATDRAQRARAWIADHLQWERSAALVADRLADLTSGGSTARERAGFVSYAQHAEDLAIWRAFGERRAGRYVDVGAGHPTIDSVTKALHERGWRGVHVEPNAELGALLGRERSGDDVVHAGCSDKAGQLVYHRGEGGAWGLSTFAETEAAKRRVEGVSMQAELVDVVTLSSILERWPAGSVDVVKIDVEGHEASVLRGADLGRYKPALVVVEATAPRTAERVDDAWRHLLEEAGYVEALFDGLNVFFVHGERPEVAAALHSMSPAASVSACLIVKDEADMLPDCLASLRGSVDEIVVYDTGSTDGTVAIARAAGARVIEGYWDDDFSRARNAALAECRGTWILHIDADERLIESAGSLRRVLDAAGGADAVLIMIENQGWDGTVEATHQAVRAFRRTRCRWAGRLHEQVRALPGQPALRTKPVDTVRLQHLGYRPDIAADRGKAKRNVALAEAELAAGDGEVSQLIFNLARSLLMDGRHEEALARCDEALVAAGTSVPAVRRLAAHLKVEVLLEQGRAAEALAAVTDLAATGESPDACAVLADRARLLTGDVEAAARLATIPAEATASSGWSVAADSVRMQAALALVGEGRWAEAGHALLSVVRDAPGRPVWGTLALVAQRGGVSLEDVAAAVPDAFMRSVLAQLLLVEPTAADALGEALHDRTPGDARLLAFASRLARDLPVPRALEWSARIRATGGIGHCPLLDIALDEARPALERLRAVAIVQAAFRDERAEDALPQVAAALAPEDFLAALQEVGELASALLPSLVTASASSAERSDAMADALDALGAAEQADAVREFGRTLNPVAERSIRPVTRPPRMDHWHGRPASRRNHHGSSYQPEHRGDERLPEPLGDGRADVQVAREAVVRLPDQPGR